MFIAKAQILELYILSISRELILVPKDKQVLFSSNQTRIPVFFLPFLALKLKTGPCSVQIPKLSVQHPYCAKAN